MEFSGYLLDLFLVALRADVAKHEIVGLLHAIEPLAEHGVGNDLPRRQSHCKVGRESVADESGDGNGNFFERILIGFVSPVAPMRLDRSSANEPIPFGNVNPRMAFINFT